MEEPVAPSWPSGRWLVYMPFRRGFPQRTDWPPTVSGACSDTPLNPDACRCEAAAHRTQTIPRGIVWPVFAQALRRERVCPVPSPDSDSGPCCWACCGGIHRQGEPKGVEAMERGSRTVWAREEPGVGS